MKIQIQNISFENFLDSNHDLFVKHSKSFENPETLWISNKHPKMHLDSTLYLFEISEVRKVFRFWISYLRNREGISAYSLRFWISLYNNTSVSKSVFLKTKKVISRMPYLSGNLLKNVWGFLKEFMFSRKRSVPGNSSDFMKAVFRDGKCSDFSGVFQPNSCSFFWETAWSRRENSMILQSGALFPYSIDFRGFPAGNDDFSWAFRSVPVVSRRSESSSRGILW